MRRVSQRLAHLEAQAGESGEPTPSEIAMALRRQNVRMLYRLREVVDKKLHKPEPLYRRLTDRYVDELRAIEFWSDTPELEARDKETVRRACAGAQTFPDARGELIRRLRQIAERRKGQKIDPDRESIATLLALAAFGGGW